MATDSADRSPDTFARVDGQWRIKQRVEEKSHMYLTPATPGMG